MTLREDILAVMRDGCRIDRFLEITCVDDPPCELFLTTENIGAVQFKVPVSLDGEPEQEEDNVDSIIAEATAYLMENA